MQITQRPPVQQAMLERAALEGPLLVCLDDLQRADSGTVAALRALPPLLAALPIAWMIAFRPEEGSDRLLAAVDYLREAGAAKIVVGPLDQAAIGQVASDVMQAEPDHALLDLSRRAAGSPFMLIELLAGLRDERLVRLVAGRAELVESRLPDRVRDTMRERLARMPGPARRTATVAASLGRRFSLGELSAMLGQSPSALLEPVEELIHAGLLIETDERLAFQHDLTREAVRASLPGSSRRALDRQAVDVLLASGAPAVGSSSSCAAQSRCVNDRR